MTRPAALRAAPAVLFALLLLSLPAATAAEEGDTQSFSRYGPRVGFSIGDLDQFTIGAFLGFSEFSPGFRFRPSVDLGFGDNIFTILMNGDAQYTFHDAMSSALPFAGAGLGLGYYDFDGIGSTTEVGLNLYGGLEKDLGGYKTGMIELRVGIGDIPDFKITAALGFM